jgi:hypothetical protein
MIANSTAAVALRQAISRTLSKARAIMPQR